MSSAELYDARAAQRNALRRGVKNPASAGFFCTGIFKTRAWIILPPPYIQM